MTTQFSQRRRALAVLGAAAMLALPLGAQTPTASSPARLMLGFPAGGSFDAVARLLADRMGKHMNRTIIVENRPGAGGRLAADLFRSAPGDGSVVMFAPSALATLYPFTVAKLGYDPQQDLVPLGTVAEFPFALAVGPGSQVRTLQDIVAAAKAAPTQAVFGTPAMGAPPHFYGLVLGEALGVKLDPAPFQGSAPVNQALMGNHIPLAVDVMPSMVENHKAGKIRVLAVSTEKRAPQLPDVPTFAELGLPAVTGADFNALYAPRNTPPAMVAAWNQALVKVIAEPEVRQRLIAMGFIPVGKGPEEQASRTAADARRWQAVVKSSGFVAQ